ncbi:acetyl-CoA sensor PanZ family protein [Chromohalobacter sp. HP20-39]|uniref:acetyl-CoA sensor PanZ family protein n=1 Tax=Chromohalobacter sp. HP20-39 TaxID=3079306 RepID=UPI00294AB6A1|nr:acetyl-CoA sensor PanZ family protein [Chromohalobacter sp. HP20-39]MDV6320234.1 acetyl-CoA sensor PanZ family protein [Chromohalobacter sp. HP20-39]
MPVTLQEIDRAQWEQDVQVAQDLARIYHDAPAERLPAPVERFIDDHFTQGGTFCCALFNARRLGAVAVRRETRVWWLSHFCVRTETRHRGVGSRLLTLIAERARDESCMPRVPTSVLMMGDQLLLTRLGYHPAADGTYYELHSLASQGGRR